MKHITGVPRGFKGIWIPREIWLAENLTPMETIFLAEINSLEVGNGCIATDKYFAEFFGISERMVRKYLQTLKDKKYIQTVKNGKKRQIYVMDTEPMVPEFLEQKVPETGTNSSRNTEQKVPIFYKEKKEEKKDRLKDLSQYGIEKVKLTEEEFNKLIDRYGRANLYNMILDLDNYIINNKGGKYKDHCRVIETWFRRRGVKPKKEDESLEDRIKREKADAKKFYANKEK